MRLTKKSKRLLVSLFQYPPQGVALNPSRDAHSKDFAIMV